MKLSLYAVLSTTLLSTALAAPPTYPGASPCCNKLEVAFPNETYVNSGDQSVKYQARLDAYFNVPDALPPNCFIQPTTTKQISIIVSTLASNQCKFAVKGGGHMLYIGSNAIKNGVTVDLGLMKNTTLNKDNTTASVEPGATWGDVYSFLSPRGISIPGGRASQVGVAGLTLGGGNSFFAARYGFVCDNVKNFEIVLGNGTITNANAKQNPDLFKGLKGGSGNLGLVTRFDFIAFPNGPLWGGIAVYPFTDFNKTLEPFVKFTDNLVNDPYGSIITIAQHNGTSNESTFINLYEYTGNATAEKYYTATNPTGPFPKPLQNFSKALGAPVASTLRVNTLYNLTHELNSVDGVRNIYSAIIFKADTTVLTNVNSIIENTLKPYSAKGPAPYMLTQTQFQPIPRVFTQHSIEKGGNVLGLDRVKDNSILLNFLVIWDDAAQDKLVQKIVDDVLTNITKYTKSVPGAYRDWQYVNYANADQDPIGSYGQANIDYLKAMSQKYDPQQVFQKLSPGGWKLGDAGKRKKQFNYNNFVEK